MTAYMERNVVRLGGKGSSTLSSSSVFQVANGLAPLSIDSSALSRLSSDSSSSAVSFFFSLPDYFTSEEATASILLLLNKLFFLSPSSSFPSAAVTQLSNFFFNLNLKNNNNPTPMDFKIDGISPDNPDYSLAAAVDAISALLDHRSSSLALLAVAIAALSCEALRADISAFNLIDSGDGSSSKDDVSVASDFKVFFNGSKLVNGKVVDPSVSKIPVVYGNFREICRLLHSRARVQLSTAFKDGTAEVMSTVLSSLALSLSNLADTSSRRANLLIESLPANDLRLILCSQRPACIDSVQQL